MSIPIMIFSPHPDDAELCLGGFILEHSKRYKILIVNLTNGDYSQNGNNRYKESLEIHNNYKNISYFFLNFKDFSINHFDEQQQRKIVNLIRKFRPSIIISTSEIDCHPDHKEASYLVRRSIYAASSNIYDGIDKKYKCKYYFQYSQELFPRDKKIVYFDITKVYEEKIALIENYKSQFYEGTRTFLNTHLLNKIKSKDQLCGSFISVKYAEQLFLVEGEFSCINIFKITN